MAKVRRAHPALLTQRTRFHEKRSRALRKNSNARQPFGDLLIEKTMGHPAFQVRDLFERFLPEEKRVQKLGANIKAEAILALKGDAASGRKLFFQEGVQCSRCHRIKGEGTDFGPDLSQIAQKYDPASIC